MSPWKCPEVGLPPLLLGVPTSWASCRPPLRARTLCHGRHGLEDVMHLQRELAQPHLSHFKSQAAAGLPREATADTLLQPAGRNWDVDTAFCETNFHSLQRNQAGLPSRQPKPESYQWAQQMGRGPEGREAAGSQHPEAGGRSMELSAGLKGGRSGEDSTVSLTLL